MPSRILSLSSFENVSLSVELLNQIYLKSFGGRSVGAIEKKNDSIANWLDFT